MLEKKDDILKSNYLLRKRQSIKAKKRSLGTKNRLFVVAVILAIFILAVIYIVSPFSKVYRVTVYGNTYLSDEHYRKLSGISDSSLYYLSLDGTIEKRIKEDPLVESVEVKHSDHRIISIEVKEKKIIAYIYDDQPYLIDADGEAIPMTSEYYDLISLVPIIEGYSRDEIKEIARGFKNVDDEMIYEISEIHKYPFSYDDRMMEVIMRSGNYVYVSYYGLTLLNNYHSIEASLDAKEDHVCIYLDEVTNSGYTSECPYWKEDTEKQEPEDTEEPSVNEAVPNVDTTDDEVE